MKPIDGYTKLRGGYYTPEEISEFITTWAIRKIEDRVLEPSCGDGSFLKVASDKFRAMGASDKEIYEKITGVELDAIEAKKAKIYGAEVVCEDFFSYYEREIDEKKQYDVVIGNPPFIRYQNFDEEYRTVAFSLMKKHGFKPSRLTNIWLPFLLLACKALKPGGRVGMVIPAELFQVDYAAEARLFLSTYFENLNLVTFKKIVFDDIQQEVILLMGERKSDIPSIKLIELDGLDDLVQKGQACLEFAEIKRLNHSRDKWVKYYLSNEELDLLDRLYNDSRISNVKDLYEVNVGLVSGENDFFVVNQETVRKFDLQGSVTPIISRSEQVKGLTLTNQDYVDLADSNRRVYFFEPGNLPMDDLSEKQQAYIRWGEANGYHSNYKCRIRRRWYHVSHTWKADAFLIRQANLYPKMILNTERTLVTDTLHKVRFKDNVYGANVASAFLNSYTLALGETLGRSYGGGVLTFEPGEMRGIRIPMHLAETLDFEKIDTLQRDGKIEDILEYTDEILLLKGLGLPKEDILMLRGIWEKMRNRRLSRKKKRK